MARFRDRAPTRVGGGTNGRVVPLVPTSKFLALIEQSWCQIPPRCGHWAMLDQPDDFAAQTTRFLMSRTGAPAATGHPIGRWMR